MNAITKTLTSLYGDMDAVRAKFGVGDVACRMWAVRGLPAIVAVRVVADAAARGVVIPLHKLKLSKRAKVAVKGMIP